MTNAKKLAVCVDGSDRSRRVLRYVGGLLSGTNGFTIVLLHVLEPLPPEFRESPGAETVRGEENVERALREKQARQVEAAEKNARPILEHAKALLTDTGVPAHAVTMDFAQPFDREEVPKAILNAARESGCGTVVIGRASFSLSEELFRSHLSDELLEEGGHLALWIVQ